MKKIDFLSDFDPVSSKQWKQKIQMDLKGGDYNATLVSETLDQINIQPFYKRENFKKLNFKTLPSNYKIVQSFFISNEKSINKLAINAINNGVNALVFEANDTFDIDVLTKNLPNNTSYFFKFSFFDSDFINSISLKLKDSNFSILYDSIHHLVKNGNWIKDQVTDFLYFSKNENLTLSVNGAHYQNSGANIIQQIAYTLAHLTEYINAFELKNKTITVELSAGSNYFFEIAKLKAFRYLFNLVTKQFDKEINLNLLVTPSARNKTVYDYNSNMLRTTSECMSAVLGGADMVCNLAYDSVYHKKNDFGERIAKNQLLILREESYFKESNTFASGSYYIESLTNEIAEKALKLFKLIEGSGGFIKHLKAGTIQKKINESAKKEQEKLDRNELVLLGTNKYQNDKDKMQNELELYPFIRKKANKTIIKTIVAKRLTEKLEQERLKQEKQNK